MVINGSEAALSASPHSYQFEQVDELTPGETGDQLYSCHDHVLDSRSKSALVIFIPLFLGALVSNSCVVYVLRKFGSVIGRVTCHFVTVFMVTDLMKGAGLKSNVSATLRLVIDRLLIHLSSLLKYNDNVNSELIMKFELKF